MPEPGSQKKLTRLIDPDAALAAACAVQLTSEQVVRYEIGQRRLAFQNGRCPPLFVVVVRVERCFGGPQEGGWWYDWRSIEEVRRVWGFKTLLRAVRELRSAYHRGGRPNRFSVIGGPDYELIVTPRESEIETLESTKRPTYE